MQKVYQAAGGQPGGQGFPGGFPGGQGFPGGATGPTGGSTSGPTVDEVD